ncbi:hypothetical protein CFOL_v3_32300 [Cephalotus follicularis]|uniref:C2H2-type domain-containing protein n=1 Tax=Cephalotus follicularis TaxID=3775 RepID=A0A1Q3D8U8_CEPFO|nr:hypothetical protein CFOL_v3_32300 [Cephalotus follicularis]
MNSLCNYINIFPIKPISIPKNKNKNKNKHNQFAVSIKQPKTSSKCCVIRATSDIDMVINKQGIYTPKQDSKVVILWDLDNKPPRGPPYEAAMALKQVGERFGDIVEMSAYANRHAFIHLPQWVLEERRERTQMDVLERRGVVRPSDPYICGVCGRKCKTNLDLKKHFKQLHERERQKKLNRMRSLKGRKRQRFKERFISGNHKYNEAARDLIKPRVGYGLANELRRAGVYVKTVEDKPQAADWAVKRQMQHSMSRGIDWLVLVSDDGDFKEMLRSAREADLWVPWNGVENGDVTEKDLVPKNGRRARRRSGGFDEAVGEDGLFSATGFEEERKDLDSVLDELVGRSTGFGGVRISAFSEGEWEEDEGEWVIEVEDEDEEGDYLLDDSEDDEND